jgi:hypothetical protein
MLRPCKNKKKESIRVENKKVITELREEFIFF